MGSSETQNKALLVQSRNDPSASLRAGLGLANARPKVWRYVNKEGRYLIDHAMVFKILLE